jgi:hypothetical protein
MFHQLYETLRFVVDTGAAFGFFYHVCEWTYWLYIHTLKRPRK